MQTVYDLEDQLGKKFPTNKEIIERIKVMTLSEQKTTSLVSASANRATSLNEGTMGEFMLTSALVGSNHPNPAPPDHSIFPTTPLSCTSRFSPPISERFKKINLTMLTSPQVQNHESQSIIASPQVQNPLPQFSFTSPQVQNPLPQFSFTNPQKPLFPKKPRLSEPQVQKSESSFFAKNYKTAQFSFASPQKSESSLFLKTLQTQPEPAIFSQNYKTTQFSFTSPQKPLFSKTQPQPEPAIFSQNNQSQFSFTSPQPLFSKTQHEPQPGPAIFSQNNQSQFSFASPQTLFSSNYQDQVASSFSESAFSLFAKPQTPINVTRFTNAISTEKLLAILSSEQFANCGYLHEERLKPTFDLNDITKVAPFAVIALIDEKVEEKLSPLPRVHMKFLQNLMKETLNNVQGAWDCALKLATENNLQTVAQYITIMKDKMDVRVPEGFFRNPEIANPEIAFVLALHIFINNGNPHVAFAKTDKYPRNVVKLVVDMCMASYGLKWILESDLPEYIIKHKDTYILSY